MFKSNLSVHSPARGPVHLPGRWLSHFSALVTLLALGLCGLCHAQSAPLEDLARFPRTQLEIASVGAKKGAHETQFDVWVADTMARQEQGLMFVRELPSTQGMLFPQSSPRVANFWMKNTYIPLDMIFIAEDGRIVKITREVEPLTLQTRSSDEPVGAVLEIKGGEAARRGLRVGDHVRWQK